MVERTDEILVFEQNGKCPFDKWLSQLDRQSRARVLARLKRLQVGNYGDTRCLGKELYEFKFDFGPGYRAYFTFVEGKLVLLLCGGNKSAQDRDIEKARGFIDLLKREDMGYGKIEKLKRFIFG